MSVDLLVGLGTRVISSNIQREESFYGVGIDEWLQNDVHGGLFVFSFWVFLRQIELYASLSPLFFLLSMHHPHFCSLLLLVSTLRLRPKIFSIFHCRLRMVGWSSDLGWLRFQSIEVECVSFFLEAEAPLEELKTVDQSGPILTCLFCGVWCFGDH